jgi:trans-2-enoyl-CoA reductase
MARPDDMAQTTTIDGKTVDYIVRQERGTINRFVYSIAVCWRRSTKTRTRATATPGTAR